MLHDRWYSILAKMFIDLDWYNDIIQIQIVLSIRHQYIIENVSVASSFNLSSYE
jgi:hypothetical protein